LVKIEILFGFWLFRTKNGRSSKTPFEDLFRKIMREEGTRKD